MDSICLRLPLPLRGYRTVAEYRLVADRAATGWEEPLGMRCFLAFAAPVIAGFLLVSGSGPAVISGHHRRGRVVPVRTWNRLAVFVVDSDVHQGNSVA